MRPLERAGIARLRREIVARAHGTVLEVGAGSGLNAPHYHYAGLSSLTVSDYHLDAVALRAAFRRARRRAELGAAGRAAPTGRAGDCGESAAAGVPGDKRTAAAVDIRDADLSALPFESERFDAVVCTLVLCSVPDQRQAVSELYRVLKPGGSVHFIEHVVPSRPAAARFFSAITAAWRRVAGGCRLNRNTERVLSKGGFEVSVDERRLDGVFIAGSAQKRTASKDTGKSNRRVRAAATLSLLLLLFLFAPDRALARDPAFTVHAPRLVSGNPAWWASAPGDRLLLSVTPPLGLAQAAFPPRTPATALDDPDSFNVLALLDSLLYPSIFSRDLPELLDGIDLSVSEDALSIVGFREENGEEVAVPLSISTYGGARSPRIADRGGLPDPFVIGRFNTPVVPVEYTVYSGGLGAEVRPGTRLAEDLADGELESGRTYTVDLFAAGQVGASLAPIVTLEYPLSCARLLFGVRPLFYVDAAWFSAEARWDFSLSDSGTGQGGDARIAYGYPGEGLGIGARLDSGVLYEAADWSAGLGVRNSGSITRRWGVEVELSDPDTAREFDETKIAFAPEARLDAAWFPEVRTGSLGLFAQVGLAEYVHPSADVIYRFGRAFIRGSFEWDDGVALDAAVGFRANRLLFEIESTSHPYPFTGGRSVGLGLSATLLRGDTP